MRREVIEEEEKKRPLPSPTPVWDAASNGAAAPWQAHHRVPPSNLTRRRVEPRAGDGAAGRGVKPAWFELQHGAASVVAKRLQAREAVPEPAFDRFLGPRLRAVAEQHWTPLAVTQRVAQWIEELGIESVVDLGSGAGKFCVATAVSATRCRFIGIEQRPWLVEAARELAEVFGVADRVQFINGTLGDTPIPLAAAYYLFNPFGENLFDEDSHIDEEVELSGRRYGRDITTVAQFLARQPPGVFVIKYNGYGGKMPRAYEVVRRDVALPDLLRVWQRK